jgi:hypothetical protein
MTCHEIEAGGRHPGSQKPHDHLALTYELEAVSRLITSSDCDSGAAVSVVGD